MDAADSRLVADVVEWLFGEILLDAMLKPADQRSSIRPVIWRSVAEQMAVMLRKMECHCELLGNPSSSVAAQSRQVLSAHYCATALLQRY